MPQQHKSLDEVHNSVSVNHKTAWRRILAFFGPAYLVSVGYMDPGNWATDLAGGSQFGYTLIWVLVMSNIMALLLQSLSARLGIVRGKDLAQCNRELYPKKMNWVLYGLAEVAIIACDLAEVLGMAIGLQLLFGMDLIWGVLISFVDTFLLLYLQRFGMRKLELFIIGMIALIGMCFLVEMFLAKPDVGEIAKGLIPSIPNSAALYIAIGMIGATVMPHNLYLHSALVQTRAVKRDHKSIKSAIKYNFWDSAIALNLALFVNAAILILAASVFHKAGRTDVAELEDAHRLLAPMIGSEWAPKLFAVALIAAGQSSTITGTLAGQIVMEGYLKLRINPLLRRLITRSLAIIPAILVILIAGEGKVGELLIFSQVFLSMQLAFAVIPLIYFVSDKVKMGAFAIKVPTKIFSWIVAATIAVLNLHLVFDTTASWLTTTDNFFIDSLIITGVVLLLGLLVMTIVLPLIKKRHTPTQNIHVPLEDFNFKTIEQYKRVGLALDFSPIDKAIIEHAVTLAGEHTLFVLIHVSESATNAMMEEEANDSETQHDLKIIKEYHRKLLEKGIRNKYVLGINDRVAEIKRIVEEEEVEILVVGAHGHRGFKDFIYGETINKLRHVISIPVLVVKNN